MKIVGIDYGAKRVGIAVGNTETGFAFPKETLKNTRALVKDVAALCVREDAEAIVVGESRDYKGKDNPVMEAARIFAGALTTATKLPVYFEPEYMTSMHVQRLQGETKLEDASAAAIILQSYLDRRK